MCRVAILCAILFWKLFTVQTFNFAPKPNITINAPLSDQLKKNTNDRHSSYFGYTIVLREKSIIIGAPRAQTFTANQQLRETGTIYKYNIERKTINEFVFKNTMKLDTFEGLIPNTTEQWLGGAMDGDSSDADPLIACAPQLKANQNNTITKYMHGACYWTNNTLDNESQNRVTWILSPFSCQNCKLQQVNKRGVSDYRSGEIGFSVHITPNKKEIISGAVGKLNGAGAAIHFDLLSQYPTATKGGPNEYGYKGYSVSSGYFKINNRKHLYYVATMPKANQQFGLAEIYEKDKYNYKQVLNLTGNQYGESFGYSLLVEDVNGDGLDDILIGAPNHISKGNPDVGVVYLYINQAKRNQFGKSKIESPFSIRGHFGITLSKLGDVNDDGYKDVAIGAPFADGNGAVAIFFGGPNGLDLQPRQILNVGNRFAGGMFGHGLSKGVDIDANDFNDLAIGAPNADAVFVYRAYPVVKINATLQPMESLIPINATSVQYRINFSILTNSTKIKTQELLLELSTNLEKNRIDIETFQSKGPFIASRDEQNIIYSAALTFGEHHEFKPIVLELSYRLKNDATLLNASSDFCTDCAMVDPLNPSVTKASVQYIRNNVDLQLQSVGVPSNLTLGATKIALVKYNITNVGEEAYYALLTVQSSIDINFAKLPAECAEVEMNVGTKVECSLGQWRGFKGSTEVAFGFDLSNVEDATELNITAAVSSAGLEISRDDNEVYDTIKLITSAEILIVETSTNQIIDIKSEQEYIAVSTRFEIQNTGPSSLNFYDLIIEFPIGYIDAKGAKQIYISNISAHANIDNYISSALAFETVTPTSTHVSNTSEILQFYGLNETRTTLLSCISGENNDMKKLCGVNKLQLPGRLKRGQRITLDINYKFQSGSIGKLLLNQTEYLVHVILVNLKTDSILNSELSIKQDFKGTAFKKITKRNTLWIYLVAIIGGLLLLIGAVWLLKRFGFFKRPTKDEMKQDIIEKQEKSHMKVELDEYVAEMLPDCEDTHLD